MLELHLLPLLDPQVLNDLLWAAAPLLAAGALLALDAFNPALAAGASIAYSYLSADKGKALADGGKELAGGGFAGALSEGSNVTPWVRTFGAGAGHALTTLGAIGALKESAERLQTVLQKYGPDTVERALRSRGTGGGHHRRPPPPAGTRPPTSCGP